MPQSRTRTGGGRGSTVTRDGRVIVKGRSVAQDRKKEPAEQQKKERLSGESAAVVSQSSGRRKRCNGPWEIGRARHAGRTDVPPAFRSWVSSALQGAWGGLETEVTQMELEWDGDDPSMCNCYCHIYDEDECDRCDCSDSQLKVSVLGNIYDENGNDVGGFTREFFEDGTVHHERLKLEPHVQANGFASQWLAHCEDEYRRSGFRRVTVEASDTVGGYAWAATGFGWDTEHGADGDDSAHGMVTARLEFACAAAEISDKGERARFLQSVKDDDSNPFHRRLGGRKSLPEETVEFFEDPDVRAEAKAVAAELRRKDPADPSCPPPAMIAMLGRGNQKQGESGHTLWAGKAVLLGSHWYGQRTL